MLRGELRKTRPTNKLVAVQRSSLEYCMRASATYVEVTLRNLKELAL
jgi:hypothetical protein